MVVVVVVVVVAVVAQAVVVAVVVIEVVVTVVAAAIVILRSNVRHFYLPLNQLHASNKTYSDHLARLIHRVKERRFLLF
jgi:hypothetical protein